MGGRSVLDRALRVIAAGALVGLSATLAAAQLSSVETKELRLLFLDPFQTYLVPHVGACFINSLTLARRTHTPRVHCAADRLRMR